MRLASTCGAYVCGSPCLAQTRRPQDAAADALYEDAVGGWPARPPLPRPSDEAGGAIATAPRAAARPARVELNANAVRLANNLLPSLDGLRAFLAHVLESPRHLVWLDLSCNVLTSLSPDLSETPALQARPELRSGTHLRTP